MTLTAQGCSQGKSIFKGHSDSGACTAPIITARPPRQWIITSFHLRARSTSPHTGRQPLNGTELSLESEKLPLPGTYSLCPWAWGSCGYGLPAAWKEGPRPGGNPSPLRYPLPCPKRPEPGGGWGEAGGAGGGGGCKLWAVHLVGRRTGVLCAGRQDAYSSALRARGHLLEPPDAILERKGTSPKETPRSYSRRRTARIQSLGERQARPQAAIPSLCLLSSAVLCGCKLK